MYRWILDFSLVVSTELCNLGQFLCEYFVDRVGLKQKY